MSLAVSSVVTKVPDGKQPLLGAQYPPGGGSGDVAVEMQERRPAVVRPYASWYCYWGRP